jgi:hypothetical protein
VTPIRCVFILMPMLGSVLRGRLEDCHQKRKHRNDRVYQGALEHKDSLPVYTAVLDWDRRRQVNWRSDLRQYANIEWPPAPIDDSPSGPTIIIERGQSTLKLSTAVHHEFSGTATRSAVRVARPFEVSSDCASAIGIRSSLRLSNSRPIIAYKP